MGTVILNVVIVLGIIIAGGFLIFFLGDLLMSIFSPKKDAKVIAEKKEKEVEKLQEEINKLSPENAEEVKAMPEVAALLNEQSVKVEAYNPEEEDKVEENEAVEETVETEEEQPAEEDDEDARNAYIEARRRELMERLAMISDEEDEEEEEETVDVDEVDEETLEDEEEIEEEEDNSGLVEEIADAKRALEAERAKSQALLAELNAIKAEVASQDRGEEVFLSEEDYETRLEVEEEKLKQNEKELRACKKEFIPLRRVKKTLESDEKKLRRKEALVAKQKVVLYGVNNYSDIDEEKAKKLAEDLDHLDGLKLSVASCQEVMAKNAERYPLLEKMFNILSSQNEQIKATIERTKNELAKLRAKNGAE